VVTLVPSSMRYPRLDRFPVGYSSEVSSSRCERPTNERKSCAVMGLARLRW
jgi:hypothetical protein